MILGLIKFWRLYAVLAFLVGLGISHWIMYNKGVEAERNRNVTRVVEIAKQQDRIRNLRPDDTVLIKRLRRGDF